MSPLTGFKGGTAAMMYHGWTVSVDLDFDLLDDSNEKSFEEWWK